MECVINPSNNPKKTKESLRFSFKKTLGEASASCSPGAPHLTSLPCTASRPSQRWHLWGIRILWDLTGIVGIIPHFFNWWSIHFNHVGDYLRKNLMLCSSLWKGRFPSTECQHPYKIQQRHPIDVLHPSISGGFINVVKAYKGWCPEHDEHEARVRVGWTWSSLRVGTGPTNIVAWYIDDRKKVVRILLQVSQCQKDPEGLIPRSRMSGESKVHASH